MRIAILTVGDEILIGQVVDTNAAWMARQLNAIGAEVIDMRTAGDHPARLRRAIVEAWQESDAVLMTGGLGPTRDDRTKAILAELFDDQLVFHQPTYERILKMFARWGREPTEAHHRQAFMPASAQLLPNRMGTAPGMWFERDDKVLVSMPGVPYEMEYLMKHEVLDRLRQRFRPRPLLHRTLLTVGEGESRIAKRIEFFEDQLPDNMRLAYLPNLGQVRLRLSASGPDEEALRHLLDRKSEELAAAIPDLLFGYDDDSLEAAIGRMLRQRSLTLGTAESCTGGHLAHRITTVAGSSDYFQGSIVAYANEVKVGLLEVSPDTLQAYGAVSEAVVREMVAGALERLQVDLAVSTSGIAGPGGGTSEKPVGTVWMAVGNRHTTQTRLLRAGKDRLRNIEYSSVQALNLLRQFLLEHYPTPEHTPAN